MSEFFHTLRVKNPLDKLFS